MCVNNLIQHPESDVQWVRRENKCSSVCSFDKLLEQNDQQSLLFPHAFKWKAERPSGKRVN